MGGGDAMEDGFPVVSMTLLFLRHVQATCPRGVNGFG